MAKYFYRLENLARDHKVVECGSLDEARNGAVRYLGAYLAEHPGFADEGHWRVNVEDGSGKPLLHVIVATVTPQGQPRA